MPALCRDCLDWRDGPAPADGRCAACGGRRVVAHAELAGLSIAHLDCDAFYAAVEKRDDPSLADRPVIVGGGRRGVVATCCYIARLSGVRSAMPMFKARRLCPDAVILRPRMDHYASVSREMRAILAGMTPLVEPLSLDEAFLDLSGTERLLGAPPALSMARAAAAIRERLGITVSIGLSHNKFLAKLASDIDKPEGFTVVGRDETLSFLGPRPVTAIWGVGGSLARRLEQDGIARIADLRARTVGALTARYGSMGAHLHALAHGRDGRAVTPDRPPKSISNETTFEADIAERDALVGHLWRLSLKCSDRAKAKGVAGTTVTLKLKTPDFRTVTRRTGLETPTNLADAIFRTGERLLDAARGDGAVRLLGIGIGGLVELGRAPGPPLLDDGAAARARAEAAQDRIRARYGGDAIMPGRALR